MSSVLICNAPFCTNTRNKKHSYCGIHRWERETYKVKAYKELLPLWAIKRCKAHGLLKLSQTYYHKSSKCHRCSLCKPPYNPEIQKRYTGRYTEYRRNHRLKARYQITLEEYDLLFEKQKGRCAICDKTENRKLAVDHCHVTGKVRGLLCTKCNFGIGYLNHSIPTLESAIKYLRPISEA